MLNKNQIKFISSLKQKKYRDENRLFIAEGVKIVPELMNSSVVVKQIYATSEFLRANKIPNHIERFEIKENELERISALTKANEVLAVCEMMNVELEKEELKGKLTLILDDIKDPGNLGTIIRIADWFGIENIVCSLETADVFNPKVVQATMGSIARVKVHYTDLEKWFQVSGSSPRAESRGRVYGALLEGKNLYSEKLSAEGIIIIGNESKGISEKLIPFITDKISIPSFSHLKSNVSKEQTDLSSRVEGEAESLNAAIAAAVICAEFRRR